MNERSTFTQLALRPRAVCDQRVRSTARPTGATVTVASLVFISGVSGALGIHLSNSFGAAPQVVAIIFLVIAVVGARRVTLPRFVLFPLIAYLVLTVLATVVSLFSSTAEYAFRGFMGLTAVVWALLAVAAVVWNADKRVRIANQRFVAAAVGLLAIICGFWALRQSFFGFTTVELISISQQSSTYLVGSQIRSSGTFLVNQEFGFFAAVVVPALLVLIMQIRISRLLNILALSILLAALFVSLLRTALIGAVIASVIALLFFSRGRHLATKILATLFTFSLLLAGSYLYLSQSTDPRIQDAITRMETLLSIGEDGSFNERTDRVWLYAQTLIAEHPFGLGAGSAGPVSERFAEWAPAGNVTTDNGYLMIGVQAGWMGMIVFCWMLVAILLWLSTSKDPWARAAAASLVALLVCMIGLSFWALLAPALVFGAVIGLGVSGAISSPSTGQTVMRTAVRGEGLE